MWNLLSPTSAKNLVSSPTSVLRYNSGVSITVGWQVLVKFVRVFFFQAEDGIRDYKVTGVQTCALPISRAYHVIDSESHVQVRAVDDIKWELDAIELGGYPHFMLKEICEQAETVRSTLRGRLVFESGAARLNGLNLSPDQCAAIRRIVIVGCGTSWHAGLVGRHVIQELAGIPVAVEYASEYRYSRPIREPGTVAVAISQSGETADTLEAMRAARAGGAIRVLGIVNVVGSTIAREADGGIYLHAGPEIGVASTKAFTSQIVALTLLGLYLGHHRGLAPEAAARRVGPPR